MKKIYKMLDLDCANCAAKMETAINKIEGVNAASVNFLAQKLTIDLDETRIDEIMKQVTKAVHKVDPNCDVVQK